MKKQSVSPQEHLTRSVEMPQVNCKEVSGPEGSIFCTQGDICQPGQHVE